MNGALHCECCIKGIAHLKYSVQLKFCLILFFHLPKNPEKKNVQNVS